MTLTIEELAIIYPEQLLLEFSTRERELTWQKTQALAYTNPAHRWQAYLNYLCLNTFRNYLQDEPDLTYTPQIWQQENLLNLWQIINGSAIALGQTRLILIPQFSTESNGELRVQREWIDLSSWAGSYYLGIEINGEEGWLRVWGYATHEQFRQGGKRDKIDETYSLANEDLIPDLNTLWLDLEFNSYSPPQVKPLPILSNSAATDLLKNLTHGDNLLPRLSLPFSQWGALINCDRTLKTLYAGNQQQNLNQRENIEQIPLKQWFIGVFTAGWQSIKDLVLTGQIAYQIDYSFRSSTSERQLSVEGIKLIDVGMQLGDRSVALLMGITAEPNDKISIRVQLHPNGSERYLPNNIRLTLFNKFGKTLQEFKARSQDELLQLKRFTCKRGKQFKIGVSLDSFTIIEGFIVDLPQVDDQASISQLRQW